MEQNLARLITQEASNFSNADLRTLAKACKGLRSIDTKRGETRGAWLDAHDDRVGLFMEVTDRVERIIEGLAGEVSLQTAEVQRLIVEELRRRQESLGVQHYKINVVKYVIIKTLVNWARKVRQEPSLREVVVPRRPRDRSRRRSDRPKESPTFLSSPSFSVVLLYQEEVRPGWLEFHCLLKNHTPYPMQNLYLIPLIRNSEKKDTNLTIQQVNCQLAEMVDNKVVFQFLPASMGTGPFVQPFSFVISGRGMTDVTHLACQVDFPATNSVVRSKLSLVKS